MANEFRILEIAPVETPQQISSSSILPSLIEASNYVRATQARSTFKVTGKGGNVAVLDTGINKNHIDFVGKIPVMKNFTSDNGGNPDDATDGNGHGTNVSGIIVANGNHTGIAPDAGVVPIKVLSNHGGGDFASVVKALQWVIDYHEQYNIKVVSMSLGARANHQNDQQFATDDIKSKIKTLKTLHIPVVIASGNDFFSFRSTQGMSYPAIIEECISVGAIYDSNGLGYSYGDGAIAHWSREGQITPFSQRLHSSVNDSCFTDIFAPGAPISSSGIIDDTSTSIQHGTSQATPIVSGVILLMQEYYQKLNTIGLVNPETKNIEAKMFMNAPLTVDKIIECIRLGAVDIFDGDDENDNVTHTQKNYKRIDAFSCLNCVKQLFYCNINSSKVN